MADKRITTELVVKATDQFSGKFRNMSSETTRFAGKIRSELGRLQGMRGSLRLIEDFKKHNKVFRDSGEALNKARGRVRELLAEIKATKNPTDKMRRDFDSARKAAKRLEEKHHKNRRTLHGLNDQLRSAGVNTAELASEQRRLTNELGTANAAFSKQATKMERLKLMQDRIATGRERMDRSLARSANLTFVGGAMMGIGRRILSSTSGVANQSGDRQEAFTEFQNLTGASDSRIAQLRGELSGLRGVTKQSVDEMLAGLEVLVGKGMNLEKALGALPATARAAFATGTSSDEMGAAAFALYDNLKVAPEDMGRAMDIMAKSGKEGGFELTAMARKFPEVTAGARALGMEGLNATATLSSALQIAMKAAGSEDQAATNMANFFGKITAPDTVRKFKKFGVDVEKEMGSALEKGADPMEHMLGVIDKLTGGDAFKMGELFADKQVLDFLRAMIPNMEEYHRIKTESLGASGVVDEDLDRKMRDFNAQKGQLGRSVRELFTLPPEALDSLTEMVKMGDRFLKNLIKWKDEHPGFTKAVFLGATALGAMAVAGGALLTVGAGVLGTMAVMRFGLVGLGARALFAGSGLTGLAGRFVGLGRLPRFRLSRLISPLRWTGKLLPSIRWGALAGRLKWSSLIRPLAWIGRGALRFIPVIGWAFLAGELAWHLLIKPLGWDKYLSLEALKGYLGQVKSLFTWTSLVKVIKWTSFLPLAPFRWVLEDVLSFNWSDFLPSWNWRDYIPKINLSGWIKWPSGWAGRNSGVQTQMGAAREVVPLRGARATGGPIEAGLPYLAGERGPEPIFASRSAYVATNQQMRRLQTGARRIRSAGMAALATTAITGSAAAAGGLSSGKPMTTRVEINGGIHIVAPSGVSDPEGLVDLLETRLGDRLTATFDASFSD